MAVPLSAQAECDSWSREEDEELRVVVGREGTGRWREKAEEFSTGREADSLRLRWAQLRPAGGPGAKRRKEVRGAADAKRRRKEARGAADAKRRRKEARGAADAPKRQRRVYEEVRWEQLEPSREHAADASSMSEAATTRARALLGRGAGPTRWGENCERWYPLEAQIAAAVADPGRLKQLVTVGRIVDRSHPCWDGQRPSYGAFAKRDLAPDTVLGVYGGVLRLSAEVAEREEAGQTLQHFGFNMSLTLQPVSTNSRWAAEDTGQGLTIDAGGCCNELAMVNDYRSDIGTAANRHFALPEKQRRQHPNVWPVEVWLKGQPQPVMVFIVGKEKIRKGQELYIDYSDSFWERFVSEQNADEGEVGDEKVAGKEGEKGEALCELLPVAFYPVRVDGESLERRIRYAPPSRISCAPNRLSDVLSVAVCWAR